MLSVRISGFEPTRAIGDASISVNITKISVEILGHKIQELSVGQYKTTNHIFLLY